MADTTKKLRVELEAGVDSFVKGMAQAGKSTDDFAKRTRVTAKEMDVLHAEALKMDRAFTGSGKRIGEFADSVGKTSTVLARSADAFGLPAGALRTLDDVMDVAELGAGNLSKGLVGLNAASIGVAGAGLAIGVAIGKWANQFEVVRNSADSLIHTLYRLGQSQADLDKQTNATRGLKEFQAQMAASNEEAIRKQVAAMKAGGASVEELAKFYKGRLNPAMAESLGLSDKQVKAWSQGKEEAKRAAEQFQALVDTLSGKGAQEEVDQLTRAFNQLGVRGVADLEALRRKLEQLQQQGAKITDKGLLGVLGGGKIEVPKLGDLSLDAGLFELDPAVLAQGQQAFSEIAIAAAAAGLSTREIEDALDAAGASAPQLEQALAAIPVTFGSVFKDTMAQLPQVILGAIQGGGDVGKSVGSFFGGQFMTGLAGENGPLGKAALSKILGSTFGGALNAILPGLGSILGAGLGSLFDKLGGLFGGKSDVSKARDQFFSQWSDGFVGLQRELVGTIGEVGQQDFVKQLFDAKSVDEFNRIVAKIKETLASVGDSVQPVTIPVTVEMTGGASIGDAIESPDMPSFAEGTRGFVNFGEGTMAMLHGWEAVVPRGGKLPAPGAAGDVFNVDLKIDENPLQTFDSVRRQRDFTLKTVRRDLTRSLAQAVASGRA